MGNYSNKLRKQTKQLLMNIRHCHSKLSSTATKFSGEMTWSEALNHYKDGDEFVAAIRSKTMPTFGKAITFVSIGLISSLLVMTIGRNAIDGGVVLGLIGSIASAYLLWKICLTVKSLIDANGHIVREWNQLTRQLESLVVELRNTWMREADRESKAAVTKEIDRLIQVCRQPSTTGEQPLGTFTRRQLLRPLSDRLEAAKLGFTEADSQVEIMPTDISQGAFRDRNQKVNIASSGNHQLSVNSEIKALKEDNELFHQDKLRIHPDQDNSRINWAIKDPHGHVLGSLRTDSPKGWNTRPMWLYDAGGSRILGIRARYKVNSLGRRSKRLESSFFGGTWERTEVVDANNIVIGILGKNLVDANGDVLATLSGSTFRSPMQIYTGTDQVKVAEAIGGILNFESGLDLDLNLRRLVVADWLRDPQERWEPVGV